MSEVLLQISSAEVDIDGSRILRGVTLEVRANELVALMGRNGVGKTTTLRALTGLRPLRSGVMTLGTADLTKLDTAARSRAGLGYVPQGRDIFPHLTVEENLRISLVTHGIKGVAARDGLDEVYTLSPSSSSSSPAKAAFSPADNNSNSPSAEPCSPNPNSSSSTNPPKASSPASSRRSETP